MNQKTLIGFILIGAILLFWPTYLDFISPEPPKTKDVSPVEEVFIKTEESKSTPLYSIKEEASGVLK